MSLALFCSRCSSALRFNERTQMMHCPGCARAKTGDKTPAAQKPSKRRKPPLTEAQKALKKQHAPKRRQERFMGGHGILVPEEIPESVIQENIMRTLFDAGFLVVRVNSGGTKIGKNYVRFYRVFGIPPIFEAEGVPDILAFRGSKSLLIEVKDRTGQLRDSQVRFMELALKKGVQVHVCRDWESAEQLAHELVEKEKRKPTRAQWERLLAAYRIAERELGTEALARLLDAENEAEPHEP